MFLFCHRSWEYRAACKMCQCAMLCSRSSTKVSLGAQPHRHTASCLIWGWDSSAPWWRFQGEDDDPFQNLCFQYVKLYDLNQQEVPAGYCSGSFATLRVWTTIVTSIIYPSLLRWRSEWTSAWWTRVRTVILAERTLKLSKSPRKRPVVCLHGVSRVLFTHIHHRQRVRELRNFQDKDLVVLLKYFG